MLGVQNCIHTEDTDGTTAPDEHAQRADVLSGEGVLDGRGEKTRSTSEHSGLHRCRDRILGVVVLFVVRSHGGG